MPKEKYVKNERKIMKKIDEKTRQKINNESSEKNRKRKQKGVKRKKE